MCVQLQHAWKPALSNLEHKAPEDKKQQLERLRERSLSEASELSPGDAVAILRGAEQSEGRRGVGNRSQGPPGLLYGAQDGYCMNLPGQQKRNSDLEFFGGKGVVFVFLRHFAIQPVQL